MDIKELDNLMNVAFINFYTLGKDNIPICLYNVNVKDSRHLACIHIAKIIKDMYGFEFYLSNNIFNYWYLKWKCKIKKWLGYAKRKNNYKMVDMEDFVSHIEKANNQYGGFAKLYLEYFKVFDR